MNLTSLHRFSGLGGLSRAVSNDGLVLLCSRGAAALHRTDGEVLWQHRIDWPYACDLGADGTAFVGTRTNPPPYAAAPPTPSSVHRITRSGEQTSHTLAFDSLSGVGLSPDGTTLAVVGSGKDQKPRLLSTADLTAEPTPLKKGNRAGRMQRVHWATAGQRLLTLARKSDRSPSYSVGVRDIGVKKMRWYGLADSALLVGERLVTWSRTDGVQLWDLGSTAPAAARRLPGVCPHPDRNLAVVSGHIAVAQNNRLYLLDSSSLEPHAVFEGNPWGKTDLELTASPDGRFLLVSNSSGTDLLTVA